MPTLQNGSVFFFFSLYYTDINCSTIGDPHYCQQVDRLLAPPPLINNHPEPRKTSVRTCFQGLWASFDHQQPTTPENKCSRSFSGVACFLWPLLPINNPTSPEIEHSRSFSEVVGFLWASATATTINNPPEPSKSSVYARFRVLLPLQPLKTSVCARCGLSTRRHHHDSPVTPGP